MLKNATPKTHLDALAMLAMVVLCASWGFQQVTVKLALEGVPPVLQAGLRSAGATLLLLIWARWQDIKLFDKDGTLVPGLIAGGLFAGEFLLIYWGLTYTTASRGVLFLYTAPFVVAIGAHIWLPGEKLRTIQVIGLISAFLGASLAFSDGLSAGKPEMLIGDMMEIVAAFMWGATTLVVKATKLAKIPATKTLFYQLAISGLALPLLAPLFDGDRGINLTPTVLACLAFQTVIVAFASYLAWFKLVTLYPAGRLMAFSFLTPLFGALFGGLILNEPLTAKLLAGIGLVGVGIYLVNRK
jgi:drug/metabolite transporter (DMT)-like permease